VPPNIGSSAPRRRARCQTSTCSASTTSRCGPNAFEQFVGRTLHPAVANLRPDLRLLYYKAVAGPDAGNYIALFALTRESRDKYWPGGSDSDDLREAFKPVQPLTTELSTYLVEGSALTDPRFAAAVFESRTWTDFVLVAAK
jgi:hypothetical protein